ncbi:MAG: diacylglycerol/lipid kinase family protein [Ilumatobacteraceae bacterium]
MARSLGDSLPLSDAEVYELPIDLLHVRYFATNDIQHTSIATNSVVMRYKWWRGQIVAITNCGYFGEWEIAPRAHPNDGVFDVVEVDANMSCRQRLIAKSRLPLGTHMPHPSIRQHQSQSETWTFTRPIDLYLDEEFVGPVTWVDVTLEPDAMKLLI